MQITDEQIRLKAYELWKMRGEPIGSPENDWYDAQLLLRQEIAAVADAGNPGPSHVKGDLETRYGLREVKNP